MKRNMNRIRAVRKEIGRMCRDRRRALNIPVAEALNRMGRDPAEQFSMYAFERGENSLDWLVSYACLDSAIPILASSILLKHRKEML